MVLSSHPGLIFAFFFDQIGEPLRSHGLALLSVWDKLVDRRLKVKKDTSLERAFAGDAFIRTACGIVFIRACLVFKFFNSAAFLYPSFSATTSGTSR